MTSSRAGTSRRTCSVADVRFVEAQNAPSRRVDDAHTPRAVDHDQPRSEAGDDLAAETFGSLRPGGGGALLRLQLRQRLFELSRRRVL